MVNVKKIGAIATGALFVGATFGMASAAVTVPSGIASKLASGGVAQADLVVGADAPGKTADTESAKEIQDAVKAKLAATVGGDISIKFGAQSLQDQTGSQDLFTQITLNSTYDSKLMDAGVDSALFNSTNFLKYDGNADGDLKDDPDDWVIYNDIYVIDSIAGDVQMAYQPLIDSTYRKNGTQDKMSDLQNGEVVKIRGSKYVVTDNVTSDGDFELAPAITKTLTSTALDPDNAAVVTGTLKMLYDGTNLRLYDGKSLLDTVVVGALTNVKKLSSTEKTSDEYSPYDIYILNSTASPDAIKVTMIEKSQKFKVSDGEEGVLGYSTVKVKADTTEFPTTEVTFLSDTLTLVKGDEVAVPDTYYQLKFTTSKTFDILRQKDSAIVSGATVKDTTSPGKDFMDTGNKIVVTVVGADIQVEFGAQNLRDSSGSEDVFTQITLNTTYDAQLMDSEVDSALFNSTNTLKYDGNSDGDLKDDPDDWVLYNDIYVVDSGNGDVQMAYRPILDTTYRTESGSWIEDANAGEVVKIRGSKYVLTDADGGDGLDIELAPAITKTLTNSTVNPDNAAVVTGTLKLLYSETSLYMYDGNSLLDIVDASGKTLPYKLSASDKTSDEYAPYDVYVVNRSASTMHITMVEKSQKFKVSNDEEGVLGYAKVKINNSDFTTTDIWFLSDTITMVKGDQVAVPDTYYELKYTTSKVFDILRKKTSTVSSGTKLKTTVAPGKDFLASGAAITVSTTGGAGSSTPDIKIVSESTADTTGKNVVLIGGPVANTLTSDLVENGKSKVDWYASSGDIEVISSAFTSGKSAIIVAGKDRTATADAAKALADSL